MAPIPVRNRESRVTTKITNCSLNKSQIAAVPGKKPPVPMRTIHQVNECVTEPVLRVVRWKVEHCLHTFGIAGERRLSLRTHNIVAAIFWPALRRQAQGQR